MCGAGTISAAHAAALTLLGVEVTAVASRTEARAANLSRRTGARVVGYDDLPAGADIVLVQTPPAAHCNDVLRALGAGAAVLVEKPLCTTLVEADAIVRAASAPGARLLYAENLAYSPVVQQFVRRVRALGPLRHLEVRAVNPLPSWGEFTTSHWGGGALFDLGVHPLAVAVMAAAPARPVSVLARLEGSADGSHPTDEHAEVVVEFDNGLSARIVASWRAPGAPLWDAQAASDSGVVRAELLPAPALEVNGEPITLPAATSRVPAVEHYGYLGEWTAFLDDLERARNSFMDAAFGRMMLDIVCAAYASARSGSAERTPFAGPRDRTPLQLWRGG
mgnify:CR=1 FL=1